MIRCTVLVSVLGVQPVWAGSVEALFQKALLAEKEQGDLRGALADYEAVVAAFESGLADDRLALRAQERADLLRQRLGLGAASSRVFIDSLRSSPALLQIGTLRKALGFKTLSERVREKDRLSSPLERRVHDWMSGMGIWKMHDLIEDPEGTLERSRQDPVEWDVPPWIEIFVKGRLAEILEAAAAAARKARFPGPEGLYQAGLIAEKDRGDFRTAVDFYRQALAHPGLEPDLETRVRGRLDFCTQWVKN